MKESYTLLLFLIAIMTTHGCNTSDSAVDSFRSFAGRVQSEWPEILPEYKLVEPVSFDVQKTDSLVSPFAAQLSFAFSYQDKAENLNYSLTQKALVDYSYQEDKWVCKNFALTISDLEYISGDRRFFDAMKRGGVEKQTTSIESDEISNNEGDPMIKLLRECNR